MSSSPKSPNNSPLKRPAPTEPVRPRTKRRKGLNAMTDLEVWDNSDTEILAAIQATWPSKAYEHYTLALERHFDPNGEPARLIIRFECKYHCPDHSPQLRERLRSSDGTQNLLVSAAACDRRRGLLTPQTSPSNDPKPPEYSAAKHRAILSMRCARDHRSFESVVDELHRQEVELLRPGTTLPTSATVSTDVKHIYEDSSKAAALYLQSVPGALHLAVDGWTSPTSESYLGIIVFWREKSRIWRTILEFVRLTEAHTGDYMATRIHDCLKRFGIEEKIMSICLDNASNNNPLVRQLQQQIPTFRGSESRVRCLAHIINLMAKAFMSLFSSPPKRSTKDATTGNTSSSSNSESEDPNKEMDADKLEHDHTVVNGLAAEAIRIMKAEGIVVDDDELLSARRIMSKVAGLARSVNDSPALAARFQALVDKDPALQGDMRALTRRVATRWNTDRAALNSHLHFRGPVRWLTGDPKLHLSKYALDPKQWDLAAELSNVLEVFQEPTDRFSQSEVPLIHETIPELLTLRARLYDIRTDALKQNIRPITRVAAQAALLVFDKYIGAMQESDVYEIAVVMCPDRKLKWFMDRGYDTVRLRARLLARFASSYMPQQLNDTVCATNGTVKQSGNIWTQRHSSSASSSTYQDNDDSIESYLNSPPVSADVISQHGGILAYWNSEVERRPSVARMALDYLTAPASSVDAERAFSGGRLMINHLQHQMSSRTFQAQMAVGSWFNTPLLPSLSEVSRIIQNRM